MPIERTIITEWTCDHLVLKEDSGSIAMWIRRPNPDIAPVRLDQQADWDFALKYLAKKVLDLDDPATYDYPDHLKALRICWECSDKLPSETDRRFKEYQKMKAQPTEPDTAELDDIRERIEAGEALYLCSGCGEYKDEGDLVPLRECSNNNCGTVFDGNQGRNCPDCNRPFTRNLADMACPDCLDPDNLPEIVTLETLDEAVTAGGEAS